MQQDRAGLPNRLFQFMRRPLAYHALFWAVILVVFSFWEMSMSGDSFGFFYALSNNLVKLIILGGAVYYNIYVLVPNYLAKKRGGLYFLLFTLMAVLITPIENFLLFTKSGDVPEVRAELLANLHLAFIPNFFVLGTSTIVKITLDWLRTQRETQELQTKNMQSELRFLKSQINPHFLFNTLNSLYALTLKKSDKAPDIVLKLSEMMRYMLYECNEPLVLLSKEVQYIQNYLELEKLRHGHHVDIDFKTEGTISDQKIAPLMFMSFIENCFKHGLGNHISPGYVRILLKAQGNEVDTLIQNSKSGAMPASLNARSGGIGLVNVRRRLDLLYPNQYALSIEDAPDSYSVHLKISLQANGGTSIVNRPTSNNLKIKQS